MNANKTVKRADGDYRTAPIRTYEQIAAAMRRSGDATITAGHIHYYEASAIKKLRAELAEFEDYFED